MVLIILLLILSSIFYYVHLELKKLEVETNELQKNLDTLHTHTIQILKDTLPILNLQKNEVPRK